MRTYFQPITLALLRMLAAFILWQHAAQKLFGLFGGEPAAIFTFGWLLGLVEFLGSIAIGIGFLTRIAAAIVAAELLVLYIVQYLPQGFPPDGDPLGENIVLLLIVSVFLAIAGAGRFSVDAELGRRPDVDAWWLAPGIARRESEVLGGARILMGLLFLQHGLGKLGIGGAAAEAFSQRWTAGVIELFGGAAIALGLFTGPVAFLASGQMAFAYFLSHAPRGFFPIENGGERAVLFCFFFLFLSVAGGGAWTLSARRKKAGTAEKVEISVEA